MVDLAAAEAMKVAVLPGTPTTSTGLSDPLVFEVRFSGLCSFVERSSDLTVLIVDAQNSTVKPALCEHHPYLLFKGDPKRTMMTMKDIFWRSFVGSDDDGKACAWCAWDIRGYDLTVELMDAAGNVIHPAVKIDFDRTGILSLDGYKGGSGVKTDYLDASLQSGGLVAARYKASSGHVAGGEIPSKVWEMSDNKKTTYGGKRRYCQEVSHKLYASGCDHVEIVGRYGPTAVSRLMLQVGTSVLVSNYCPVTVEDPALPATDVMAYYELCEDFPTPDYRVIPRPVKTSTGGWGTTPRETACPPVVQSP